MNQGHNPSRGEGVGAGVHPSQANFTACGCAVLKVLSGLGGGADGVNVE